MVNTQIEQYQITDILGRGGFSVVYRAYDTRLQRWVALKVVEHRVISDQKRRARFAREVAAYRRLKHPNIIKVYDEGFFPDGRGFISLKLMENGTLRDLLRTNNTLRPKQALDILRDVANGLTHAHAAGVIHRDIKPENILLYGNGVACLGDFGTTRIVGMPTLTQEVDNIGTLQYMSPEHIDGLTYTTWRSDIYSLGVVLYEMMTGRMPFYFLPPLEVPAAIKGQDPVAPRQLNPGIRPKTEEVLLNALEKDPDQRYQTPYELYEAFAHALHEDGLLDLSFAPGVPIPPPPPEVSWIRRPEVWAAGILALLVVFLFLIL